MACPARVEAAGDTGPPEAERTTAPRTAGRARMANPHRGVGGDAGPPAGPTTRRMSSPSASLLGRRLGAPGRSAELTTLSTPDLHVPPPTPARRPAHLRREEASRSDQGWPTDEPIAASFREARRSAADAADAGGSPPAFRGRAPWKNLGIARLDAEIAHGAQRSRGRMSSQLAAGAKACRPELLPAWSTRDGGRASPHPRLQRRAWARGPSRYPCRARVGVDSIGRALGVLKPKGVGHESQTPPPPPPQNQEVKVGGAGIGL